MGGRPCTYLKGTTFYNKFSSYPDKPCIVSAQSGPFDVVRSAGGLSRIVCFILKPGTCTTITYLGGCATTTMAKAYLTNDPIW